MSVSVVAQNLKMHSRKRLVDDGCSSTELIIESKRHLENRSIGKDGYAGLEYKIRFYPRGQLEVALVGNITAINNTTLHLYLFHQTDSNNLGSGLYMIHIHSHTVAFGSLAAKTTKGQPVVCWSSFQVHRMGDWINGV